MKLLMPFSSLMLGAIISSVICSSTWAAIPAAPEVTPDSLRFEISEKGTDWEQTPPPVDSTSVRVLFRGRAHGNQQPTFTVRVEKLLATEKDLKDYLRRWLKEYPKFGYNVLGSKAFNLDGKNAFVVDLVSSTSGKQARQVLTEKAGEVALLTCLDSREEFGKSLPTCNTLIRNFKWK